MIKKLPTFEEFIEGGKGSGHSPEEFDQFELELGIRVELEHVSSDKEISKSDINDPDKIAKAKEIATDHLTENGHYYTDGFKAGLFDEDISDILEKWKDNPLAQELLKANEDFNNMADTEKFPHEIKSEAYWKKVLSANQYALGVLNTVMTKQSGRASNKQMEIMRRAERGETAYSYKN